eukprot:SAG31_NODE_160_length_21908_cov_25.529048_1_plen_82_part_00
MEYLISTKSTDGIFRVANRVYLPSFIKKTKVRDENIRCQYLEFGWSILLLAASAQKNLQQDSDAHKNLMHTWQTLESQKQL